MLTIATIGLGNIKSVFRTLACLALFAAIPVASAASAPTWSGYAGNAQHTALSQVQAQAINAIVWQTPIDLNPQNQGGDLLIHYCEPMITPSNTVVLAVKTGAADGFRIDAHSGADGTLKWTLPTDFSLPPSSGLWTPSFPAVLTPQNRLYFAGAGGTVYYVDNPDTPGAAVTGQFAFYGLANYQANPAFYNSNVSICTPLTADAAGNIYFGFIAASGGTLGLASGIARISPAGVGTYVSAQTAAGGDATMTKPVYNCAPALANDGTALYIAVSNTTSSIFANGKLVKLDAATLASTGSATLYDPDGDLASLPDDGTASPMIGPDGDVYFGILENPFASNNDRGWLLHFSGDLGRQKISGAFGWDDTASVVPASMVPSYAGASTYLIATKYNNYAEIGTGNGINKIAVLDPNATQTDPITGHTVMMEVLTIAGVTPDAEVDATYPGAVREWCINSAVVDPGTGAIYAGSEDGKLYKWDLTTNTFTQIVTLTPGLGEAYTPTLIGPDGTVYAVNNATLFAVGAGSAPAFTNGAPQAGTVGAAYSFAFATSSISAQTFSVSSGALPDGLMLDQSSGIVSGTPTAAGTFLGIVSATNSSGTGTQNFSFTVNPALSVTPAQLAHAAVGIATHQTLAIHGGTKPYTTFAVDGFDGGTTGLTPAAITLDTNAETVAVDGTPNAVGTLVFTIHVTDTAGAILTQSVGLAVDLALSPPTLPGANIGVAYSQACDSGSGRHRARFVSGDGRRIAARAKPEHRRRHHRHADAGRNVRLFNHGDRFQRASGTVHRCHCIRHPRGSRANV